MSCTNASGGYLGPKAGDLEEGNVKQQDSDVAARHCQMPFRTRLLAKSLGIALGVATSPLGVGDVEDLMTSPYLSFINFCWSLQPEASLT